MFVHAVYFWLDRNLTRADEERFRQRLEELGAIPTVKHCFVGRPAATNRPIIDRTYSFALTLVFADSAGQDAYQVHPIHTKFVEDCAKMWIRVYICDSE
jgi:Stress responsive A/B Barrel Domain